MRLTYRFARVLCQLAAIVWLRVRVWHAHRVPRSGGVLLACNHQSFYDPVLAGLAVPRELHYMARHDLFDQPAFARLIRYLNAYPVRRGRADLGAIRETIRRLRAGAVVCAFPEGSRTWDGRIGPFQPGVIAAAQRAGAAIVPTLIDGAAEAWPRGRALPGMGHVVVAYGLPLAPDAVAAVPPEDLAERIRRDLIAFQAEVRRRLGRRPIVYNAHAGAPGRAGSGPSQESPPPPRGRTLGTRHAG